MGFDLEKFNGDVPAEFLCPNCHSVVSEPLLAECSHVFCSKCFKKTLKRNKGCPTCEMEVSQSRFPLSLEWKRKYASLQLRCTKGCQKFVSLGNLEKHLVESCPFSLVLCTNDGCTRKIRRRDVSHHSNVCCYRVIECEGCGFRTRYVNLRMHQIVRQCVRQKNLHSIIQNQRDLDAKVKKHRLKLGEESFKRELEDRDIQKAKLWDAIARQNPCRVLSAPSSTKRMLASTANRYKMNLSNLEHNFPDKDDFHDLYKSDIGVPCVNCNKLFIKGRNREQACKWHRGASIGIIIFMYTKRKLTLTQTLTPVNEICMHK